MKFCNMTPVESNYKIIINGKLLTLKKITRFKNCHLKEEVFTGKTSEMFFKTYYDTIKSQK